MIAYLRRNLLDKFVNKMDDVENDENSRFVEDRGGIRKKETSGLINKRTAPLVTARTYLKVVR